MVEAEREKDQNQSNLEDLSFEDALTELEEIVRQLEQGRGTIDNSISAYERGTLLKKHCEDKLNKARMRVEEITVGSEGEIRTEPKDFE